MEIIKNLKTSSSLSISAVLYLIGFIWKPIWLPFAMAIIEGPIADCGYYELYFKYFSFVLFLYNTVYLCPYFIKSTGLNGFIITLGSLVFNSIYVRTRLVLNLNPQSRFLIIIVVYSLLYFYKPSQRRIRAC
jgi:hypothetical protein